MFTTQLGGPTSNNKTIFLVKYKLKRAGVRVSYPISDSYLYLNGRYFTFNPQQWSKYEVDVDYFSSIQSSDFHVVCNETSIIKGLIDHDTALTMLAAMRYRKPIVLLHKPYFGKTTDLFLRSLITRNLSKMHAIDLSTTPINDISALIAKLPKRVDYQLSTNEQALINSRIKEHFRHLLQPAKKFKLYKLERAHKASIRPA